MARYFGPFQILDKYGEVAYKLKLPPQSRVHHVFHVSQLKRFEGNYFAEPNLPARMEAETNEMFEPEYVMANRDILKNGETVRQWLVK